MPQETPSRCSLLAPRHKTLTGWKILATVLLLTLFGSKAHAQASVTGTISDESGEGVVGAKVVLTTQVGSPFKLKATTLKKGKYRVVVPQNKYDFLVTIEKEGFHPFQEKVRFDRLRRGNRSTVRNFTLLTLTGARRRALDQAAAGQELVGIKIAAQEAYNKGAKLSNSGELEGARDAFLEALEEDPAIAPAQRILMTVYYRLKDFEAAAATAREFLKDFPAHRQALEMERDSCRAMKDEACAQQAQARLEELP